MGECMKTMLPSALHSAKNLILSSLSTSTSPAASIGLSKVHHLLRFRTAFSYRLSETQKVLAFASGLRHDAVRPELTNAAKLSGSTTSKPSNVCTPHLLGWPKKIRRLHVDSTRPTSANNAQAQAAGSQQHADLEGFLERVADCNVGRERIRGPEFLELRGNGSVLGFIHTSFADQLCALGDTFLRPETGDSEAGTIELNPKLTTFEARTEAVAAVCLELKERGAISGWRNELYPVSTGFHDPPFFNLERAAAPHFGITAYGVHMNGYTEDADGNLHLWVARRSATKQTWPGRLDHLVAGGQPFGLSCADNLVKECQEEAGIRPELARRAISAGAVTYETVVENKAKRDVLFVYDLKLPLDFQPVNEDGEVESFELWPLARVAETIRTSTEYKPNVALVIIDFLVRHGFITPDQRRYIDLLSSLRTGSFITTDP